jgi:hypothetical protein
VQAADPKRDAAVAFEVIRIQKVLDYE